MKTQILKTIAFFDVLGYPLTEEELWTYLYWEHEQSPQKTDFQSSLSALTDEGVIRFQNAYYLPHDRDEKTIRQRETAMERSEGFIRSAKRWGRFLSLYPGVDSIAICNTVAFKQAGPDSDIDFLILTKPGWLWQTRFALTALVDLAGKRPRPEYEYGKFCLSFFLQSDQQDLSHIALDDDIYLDYWIRTLRTIYDPSGKIKALKERSGRLCKADPTAAVDADPEYRAGSIHGACKKGGEFAMSPLRKMLEEKTKGWQKKRFPEAIRTKAETPDTDVIINDQMLKFHTNDRRKHYKNAFDQRYQQLVHRG